MGILDTWEQDKAANAKKLMVNVEALLNGIERYSEEGLVTLTDADELNTLPATTSTPIKSLLQIIRNCLKWLFNNKINKSGDTMTGALYVPTPPL